MNIPVKKPVWITLSLLGLILLFQNSLSAQSNAIQLKVLCNHDQRVLVGVSFYVPKIEKGRVSDNDGYLNWAIPTSIDTANYVLVRHIGFRPLETTIGQLLSQKVLELEEVGFEASEIVIKAKNEQNKARIATTIDKQQITTLSDKTLAGMLSAESGISSTGMGDAMAKPVIHGLFGDRIALVKNGMTIQAHLWSREHAPPIGGLQSRSKLTLFKGASTVLLSEQALGGTVVMDSYLPGDFGYQNAVFTDIQSNGFGAASGFEYGEQKESFRWKLGWYGSANGNTTTPNYRVQNSGRRTNELQFAMQGNRPSGLSWEVFSGWNRQHFGVPNVAHIGNLDDLEEALERGRPLNSSDISYGLDSPKQLVDHLDIQTIIKKEGANGAVFSLNSAIQLNARQEFDIRRGGRSESPVTDLRLLDIQLKPSWLIPNGANQYFTFGFDWNWQKNNNISGTGIRPFIPNYTTGRIAAFALWAIKGSNWDIELGSRVGYRYLDAAYFNEFGSLNNRQRSFIPFSALAAFVYEGIDFLHLKIESGIGYRAPNVAELFASGLHHGASNYELGDPNLNAELGWKSLVQADFHLSEKLLFTTTFHSNLVDNYVFLRYSGANTFTIRGAYPVFEYVQDQAWISGADAQLSLATSQKFKSSVQASYLRASRAGNLPLPDIEPFNARFKQEWMLPVEGKLERYHPVLSWEVQYVDEQTRFIDEELFAAPPPAYALLNAGLRMKSNHERKWTFALQANNILNTEYRRYLDRLRFYVHQPGFNILANLTYEF